MSVQIVRGSRSEKYAAQDWECDCGHLNKRKEFLFFDLPPFFCENSDCKKRYEGIVYFNLADVEVNGRSIIPEVKDQGNTLECVPFAFCHAQELNDAVEAVIMSDESAIESLDPFLLADAYNSIFLNEDDYPPHHKFLHTPLILRDKARGIVKDVARSTHSDCCAINRFRFDLICHCIADGRGVVGGFRIGENIRHLQFGQVYCEPADPKSQQHAVVLIGALYVAGCTIYIFLNSWGKSFCAVRDQNGEIITGGIGMVETGLEFNPIVLGRSWEEADDGKLSVEWKRKSEIPPEYKDKEVIQLDNPTGRGTFIIKDIWNSCKSCSPQVPNSRMSLLQAAVGVSQAKACKLDTDMGSCPLSRLAKLRVHQKFLTPAFKEYARVRSRKMTGVSSGQFKGARWRQRLWKDAVACTHILEGHSDAITSTRFIIQGSETEGSLHVVTGSKYRPLQLYKCDTSVSVDYPKGVGAYKILRGHMAPIKSISTDPSGEMLSAVEGSEDQDAVLLKERRLNSVSTGPEESQLEVAGRGDYTSITMLPDQHHLAPRSG